MRRALLCGAALLAGCGGGSAAPAPPHASAARTTPAKRSNPYRDPDAKIRRGLLLPDRVPIRPAGSAPPAQLRVVRAWLDALRAGHVRAAARLFAVPSRFQNFNDIVLIRSARQALSVTTSLPCGAQLTRSGAANGYVVYDARLTDRPGGGCGSGIGAVVRGAVLVRDGRIREWYRLPDVVPPPRTPSAAA